MVGGSTAAALEVDIPKVEVSNVQTQHPLPPSKRATEAEVRAFAGRMNGGVVPTPPTPTEMDAIFEDASSTNSRVRRSALARFHQAMRALPSAEARKAAGTRMATLMANRTSDLAP